MVNRKFTHSYLRVFVLLFKMFKTLHSVDDCRVRLNYCDLRTSVRRAVSKRTFYVSKRAFAVQDVRLPFQNARLPFQNVLFFHVTCYVWAMKLLCFRG